MEGDQELVITLYPFAKRFPAVALLLAPALPMPLRAGEGIGRTKSTPSREAPLMVIGLPERVKAPINLTPIDLALGPEKVENAPKTGTPLAASPIALPSAQALNVQAIEMDTPRSKEVLLPEAAGALADAAKPAAAARVLPPEPAQGADFPSTHQGEGGLRLAWDKLLLLVTRARKGPPLGEGEARLPESATQEEGQAALTQTRGLDPLEETLARRLEAQRAAEGPAERLGKARAAEKEQDSRISLMESIRCRGVPLPERDWEEARQRLREAGAERQRVQKEFLRAQETIKKADEAVAVERKRFASQPLILKKVKEAGFLEAEWRRVKGMSRQEFDLELERINAGKLPATPFLWDLELKDAKHAAERYRVLRAAGSEEEAQRDVAISKAVRESRAKGSGFANYLGRRKIKAESFREGLDKAKMMELVEAYEAFGLSEEERRDEQRMREEAEILNDGALVLAQTLLELADLELRAASGKRNYEQMVETRAEAKRDLFTALERALSHARGEAGKAEAELQAKDEIAEIPEEPKALVDRLMTARERVRALELKLAEAAETWGQEGVHRQAASSGPGLSITKFSASGRQQVSPAGGQ